ncbi:unnamed protein product, partial [Didymodactylos carnosus]
MVCRYLWRRSDQGNRDTVVVRKTN